MFKWFKWLGLGLAVGGLSLGLSVKTYLTSLNREEVQIATLNNPSALVVPKNGELRVYYSLDPYNKRLLKLNTTHSIELMNPSDMKNTGLLVTAGQSVQVAVFEKNNYSDQSFGWVAPNADNTCGSGSYTRKSIVAELEKVRNFGETIISVQCWSDWEPEENPKYDFNDFLLIFSYVPIQGDAACMVQGYKVEAPDNVRTGPFADQTVRVVGRAEDKNNPYYLTGLNLGQTYSVSVEPETGYKTGYSVCYNQISCHDNANVVWDKISDSFTCPTASASGFNFGYVDLWWHFQPNGTGGPPPGASPSPSANQTSFVINKFLDANKNGVREVGEGPTSRAWEFEYQVDGGEKINYLIEPGEEAGETVIVNKGVKVKVSELGQEGWLNTTGAEVTKTLTDHKLYTYYFGNFPVGGVGTTQPGFPPTQPDTGTPTVLTLSLALSIMVITVIKFIKIISHV